MVAEGVSADSNRTLHIQSLNPMCLQSFISVAYPVFVVSDFKLDNKKKEKKMMIMKNLQIELAN